MKMTTLSSLFCFVLEEAGTLDGDRARCLHGLACAKKKKVKRTIHPFIPPCGRLYFPLANHAIRRENAQLGME